MHPNFTDLSADLIEEDLQRFEHTVNKIGAEAMRYGLTMNLTKTKTMVFGESKIDKNIEA